MAEASTTISPEALVDQAFEYYRDNPSVTPQEASSKPLKGMDVHQLLDVIQAFEAEAETPHPEVRTHPGMDVATILHNHAHSYIHNRLTDPSHPAMRLRSQRRAA